MVSKIRQPWLPKSGGPRPMRACQAVETRFKRGPPLQTRLRLIWVQRLLARQHAKVAGLDQVLNLLLLRLRLLLRRRCTKTLRLAQPRGLVLALVLRRWLWMKGRTLQPTFQSRLLKAFTLPSMTPLQWAAARRKPRLAWCRRARKTAKKRQRKQSGYRTETCGLPGSRLPRLDLGAERLQRAPRT